MKVIPCPCGEPAEERFLVNRSTNTYKLFYTCDACDTEGGWKRHPVTGVVYKEARE